MLDEPVSKNVMISLESPVPPPVYSPIPRITHSPSPPPLAFPEGWEDSGTSSYREEPSHLCLKWVAKNAPDKTYYSILKCSLKSRVFRGPHVLQTSL